MSNPVVTIGNSIPTPDDPEVVRKTFTRIVYESQSFFTYEDGMNDTLFDPTNKGQRIYLWQQIGVVLAGTPGFPGPQGPTFVSDEAWKSVQHADSGFLTAVHSAMPKLMVPSKILVDNGIITDELVIQALHDQSGQKNLFNWEGTYANDVAIANWPGDWYRYVHVAGYYGSQYVTTRHKDDTTAANNLTLNMVNPGVPPNDVYPAPTGEWEEDKDRKSVV